MQERILQHLCNNMKAQDNDGDPTYTFDTSKPQKANITAARGRASSWAMEPEWARGAPLRASSMTTT